MRKSTRTKAPQAAVVTGLHPVTIRLPVILYRRLKAYCAQNGLKVQDFTTHIIALHLHEHTAKRIEK